MTRFSTSQNTNEIGKKRTRRTPLAAILTLLLTASAVSAQQPALEYTTPARCSDATLSGTYAVTGSGTIGGVSYIEVGKVTYDGHGHGLATSTSSAGGRISKAVGTTAVYTVNPDCTGSKTFGGTITFDFVVSPNGKLIYWIVTNADTILSGHAERLE